MTRRLNVDLNGVLVGLLEQESTGSLRFQYCQKYIKNASIGISISLPLQSTPFKDGPVKTFFSGLLPDENVRERLAKNLGFSEQNTFGLLEAIAGDCAGALTLYPEGSKVENEKPECEVLDNQKLKELLSLIKRQPMLAGDDGYRLSLAGAQDKLAVGFKDNKILLIKNGAPTTHILKPMINNIKDSAHNELFCMKLAKTIGIETPDASLHYVGDTPYYLVERYDRLFRDNEIVHRIHQEDFCQALSIAPELKYQREGGPSIVQCQNIIKENALKPAVDQIKFLNMLIFNFLIGNADAHGKNFSLLYKSEKPQLSPAYDLLSTVIYPDLSQRLAMKIGKQYKPHNIYLNDFCKLVPNTKIAQLTLTKQVNALTKKLYNCAVTLEDSLKSKGIQSDIYQDILNVIKTRSAQLA